MARKRQSINQLDLEAREIEKTGANKKKFSIHDLKVIKPITQSQKDLFESYYTGFKAFVLKGVAGSGKSLCAAYLSLQDILDPKTPYKKIIFIKSAVPVRSQGFVPGTLEEKEEIYEVSCKSVVDELFPYSKSYENLKKNGYIEFTTTSYIRGCTFHDSIIIAEEFQSMSFSELDMVMSRVGSNCKILFVGDSAQNDLNKSKHDVSGLSEFMRVVGEMDDFAIIESTTSDIVRSGLVKRYIERKFELGII